MMRTVVRTYTWDKREVAEALIAQLKAKDIPAPGYVGDTKDTKWTTDSAGGITVEWTDAGEVDVV